MKKQQNIRKRSETKSEKKAGKEFSKISLGHVLSIANAHLYGKNQKNLMMKSRENAKKPVFPKNQQKLMSQCREKLVTNGRTDGRTDKG